MQCSLISYDNLCVSCPKCQNSVDQSEHEPRHKLSVYGFTFQDNDTFTCDNCAGQLCIAQYMEGEKDITNEFYPLIHASNLKLAAQELWDKFSDIPVNNNDEIETAFEHFPIGTCRFDVWHWFEDNFNISIKDLEG